MFLKFTKKFSIQHWFKTSIETDLFNGLQFKVKIYNNTSSAYGAIVYKDSKKFIDISFNRKIKVDGKLIGIFEVNELALYFNMGVTVATLIINKTEYRIEKAKDDNKQTKYLFLKGTSLIAEAVGGTKSIFLNNVAKVNIYNSNEVMAILCLFTAFINHDLIPDSNTSG